MSHVTTVKFAIRNLDILEAACKKLGLVLNRNQRQYRWFGRFVGDYVEEDTNPAELGLCDHAISIPGNPGAYEVGVVARGDIFILRYDFHAGGMGLEQVVGPRCSKLIEAYTQTAAVAEAMKLVKNEGYVINVEEDPKTGEIIITLRSY